MDTSDISSLQHHTCAYASGTVLAQKCLKLLATAVFGLKSLSGSDCNPWCIPYGLLFFDLRLLHQHNLFLEKRPSSWESIYFLILHVKVYNKYPHNIIF